MSDRPTEASASSRPNTRPLHGLLEDPVHGDAAAGGGAGRRCRLVPRRAALARGVAGVAVGPADPAAGVGTEREQRAGATARARTLTVRGLPAGSRSVSPGRAASPRRG